MKNLLLLPVVPATALLFVMAALCPATAQVPTYQITDIGTLSVYDDGSYLCYLNNLGEVSGTRETGGLDQYGQPINHAFLWSSKGGLQDLGTLGGTNSYGRGINNDGEIVGASEQANGSTSGFVWQKGQMTATSYQGTAINDSGQIAGVNVTSPSNPPLYTAIRYSNGAVQNLGTLGGTDSAAYGINAEGQVVGYSDINTQTGFYHAFVWSPATGMVDLDTPGNHNSLAYSINDKGQIVGISSQYGPTLWQDGKAIPLGGPSIESGANAINDEGQAVGYSPNARGLTSAVIWENGQMYDLNSLVSANSGWFIYAADDINDRGQILCVAEHSYGETPIYALLLSPAVPEPGAIVTSLSFALSGTILLLRRRQRFWQSRQCHHQE